MSFHKIRRSFTVLVVSMITWGLSDAAAQTQGGYGGGEVGTGAEPVEFERTAGAGWQFLKLPTHARYAAMGGISSSIGRADASTALGNPASITDVANLGASVTVMNWIADISYQSGSVVKNFGRWGTFGLNLIAVDYGEMARTEHVERLNDLGEPTGLTQPNMDAGTVTGGNLAVGLNYGRRVTDRLQLGGTLRRAQETLDGAKTSNWMVDVGTLYYTGIQTLRLSMVGKNFGPDAQFARYSERIGAPAVQVPTPMIFQFGAAMDVLEGGSDNPHLWTLAAEFTRPNDGAEKVHMGTEYTYMDLITFRGGYRFNYDEQGLTLGGGLRLHTGSYGLLVNYAYLAFGRLTHVHMFSVGFDIE